MAGKQHYRDDLSLVSRMDLVSSWVNALMVVKL